MASNMDFCQKARSRFNILYLATVKSKKADVSSVDPSSERLAL